MKGKKSITNFKSNLRPYSDYTIIEELEDGRIYWFNRDAYVISTREFRDEIIKSNEAWDEQFREWGRTGPIASGELVMNI